MPKVVAVLLVLVALVACGGPAASSTPAAPVIGPAQTPGPPDPTRVPGASPATEAGVLMTYETRGGLCPNGPCGARFVIHEDGTIERTDGLASAADPKLLERLVAAIQSTDWEAVLAVPFTGECPVNVDGQEQVYTFAVKDQSVTVASCTTQVDPSAEPYVIVQEILFGTGG